ASRDRGADAGPGPGRLHELPIEHEMPVGAQAGRALDAVVEQLADRRATGLLVDDVAKTADQRLEVRLIAVVDVDLAVPRLAPRLAPVGRQVRMLEQAVEDAQTRPVHAAVEPAAD